MSELLKDIKTLVIALATVVVSAIIATTYYNVNDRILMSRNIDSAIAKGLDPISVRCSFVTNTDTVCVAYAASSKK
jgi:L-lactate permease